MGSVDELDANINVYDVTFKICDQTPDLQLQTMTVMFKHPKRISLTNLYPLLHSHLDAENFPGLQVWKYKPIHVNVFSSGIVIMCGIKNIADANLIKLELESLLLGI